MSTNPELNKTICVGSPRELLELLPSALGSMPSNCTALIRVNSDGIVVGVETFSPAEVDNGELTARIGELSSDTCDLVVAYFIESAEWYGKETDHDNFEISDDQLLDILQVRGGKWRSLMCTNEDCCPADGHALPVANAVEVGA